MSDESREGWVYLPGSKRLHYFCIPPKVWLAYSFCDKWSVTEDDEGWRGFVSNPQPADCCQACERMRGVYARRQAKEARGGS